MELLFSPRVGESEVCIRPFPGLEVRKMSPFLFPQHPDSVTRGVLRTYGVAVRSVHGDLWVVGHESGTWGKEAEAGERAKAAFSPRPGLSLC